MSKHVQLSGASLLMILILTAACGGRIPTKTYELGEVLTIEYPEDWQIEENLFEGFGVVVFSPEERDFSTGLGLGIFYIPAFMTVEGTDAGTFLRDFARDTELGDLGENETVRSGANEWQQAEFEYKDEDEEIQGKIMATEVPDGFVLIVAAAQPDTLSEYNRYYDVMLRSVTFK
jgi:hypothetical protein